MKTALMTLSTFILLAYAPLTAAHETPGISHTHAFKQTGYGTYRQGHSVNNSVGSITIWSAKPHTGYDPRKSVKFARPEMIRKAPGAAEIQPAPVKKPASDYGKPKKD
jgi:hypothetical protein